MDFSKLSKTQQLVGIGALVGVISAFLPWYSWNFSAFGVSSGGSINGMTSWWMLSFVAAVLALAMVALPMFGVKLPKLGVEDKVVYMILGAVTGGIPVLALVSGASNGMSGYGGSTGAGLGIWGAIAGGAIMLFGAFMDKGAARPVAPTETPKE